MNLHLHRQRKKFKVCSACVPRNLMIGLKVPLLDFFKSDKGFSTCVINCWLHGHLNKSENNDIVTVLLNALIAGVKYSFTDHEVCIWEYFCSCLGVHASIGSHQCNWQSLQSTHGSIFQPSLSDFTQWCISSRTTTCPLQGKVSLSSIYPILAALYHPLPSTEPTLRWKT